jgi:hypothetical protein
MATVDASRIVVILNERSGTSAKQSAAERVADLLRGARTEG